MSTLLLQKQTARNSVIDFSRFGAILTMVLAHVIAITYAYDSDNAIVYWLGVFGGTISFTLFLFLSGASVYLSYIAIPQTHVRVIEKRKQKILIRTAEILCIYYVLAFTSAFVFGQIFQTINSIAVSKDILRIMLFLEVPPFTEFLLAFIFFNISAVFLRSVYVRIVQSTIITVAIGIILYVSGELMYHFSTDVWFIDAIKALFAGHENVHTFPVLHYSIVYLLGMLYGFYSEHIKKIPAFFFKHSLVIALATMTILLGTLSALFVVASTFSDLRVFDTSIYSGRFPPTVGFIIISLFLTSVVITLGTLVQKRFTKKMQQVFLFFSKYTISFLVVHTILLLLVHFILEQTSQDEWQVGSTWQILFVYGAIVLMSSVLIAFISSISSFIRTIDKNGTFRNLGFLAIALVSIVFTLFVGFQINSTKPHQVVNAEDFSKVINTESNAEQWFDHSFFMHRPVVLQKNESDQPYDAAVSISRIVGNDASEDTKISSYQLVALNTEGAFTQVNTDTYTDTSGETFIVFEANQSQAYYLYYNNNESVVQYTPETITSLDSSIALVDVGAVVTHQFEIQLSQNWFLVDYPDQKDIALTISAEEKSMSKVAYSTYEIINTDINGTIPSLETGYQTTLTLDAVPVGNYAVQATLYVVEDETITIYKTAKAPLWISYPLYVSWSMDWEGYGVNETDLNDIVSISDKYQMPITQFFNPRIYIEKQYSTYEVTPAAADYYTRWVLNRRNEKGDEIGLHIHMYPDLLEAMEIEKNEAAQIVGIFRDETYLQGYDYEDLTKAITWSLEQFQKNGITNVTTFRSGAWMSGPTLLQVLEEQGFTVDSSGRTAGLLNPAYATSTPIPWNLPATVKPYKPNRYDINSWNAPELNIWELANNGADSYWFSAQDLIERFKINYPTLGNALERPQAVVYLSHPHGFVTYDSEKIRSLFEYTENYAYKNNNGPVVYETIGDIYTLWNKTQFTDGE